MDLMKAMAVSAGGMHAQSSRMQVVAENIANAQSVVGPDGNGPYRRQQIHFQSVMDDTTGLTAVKVASIKPDNQTPLKTVYDPSHQLADENGYVSYPNVDTFTETIDMRDAARAYEANMQAIESAKEMMVRSLDLIR